MTLSISTGLTTRAKARGFDPAAAGPKGQPRTLGQPIKLRQFNVAASNATLLYVPLLAMLVNVTVSVCPLDAAL